MPNDDPLFEMLNEIEAIVLSQPDKKQQGDKLREIGKFVTPGQSEGASFSRAFEWVRWRVKKPREQLKLSQWLAREKTRMTVPQTKAFKKRLKEVVSDRSKE